MEKLEKFTNKLMAIELWITTPVFLIMLTLMLVQVVCRYFLQIPTPWLEEVCRFLFIASIFWGAAIATGERTLIEINFTELMITSWVKGYANQVKVAVWANVFRDALSLFFMAIVTYQAYLYTLFQAQTSQTAVSMLWFPMWIVTGSMFVGMVLTIVHLVGLIILNLAGRGPMGYDFLGEDTTCNL
ncbi:MAG: TRAP transporter small permease [Methylocystaceae bacterium]